MQSLLQYSSLQADIFLHVPQITGRTTMNIGVFKLCRIYYSDLAITNYCTSNERATQTVCPASIRVRVHALVPPSSVRSTSSQDGN